MRKFAYSLAAMVVLSLVALAQGEKSTTTVEGVVLMDKACSARHLKAANPQDSAAKDSKGCALKKACADSGFGYFKDGKFVEFTEKGNALAKAALEKTTKDSGATFTVTGKLVNGKLDPDKITEK